MLNGFIAWVQSDVTRALGTLAIMGLGVVLMLARFSPFLIIGIPVGIWVAFNPEMLLGLLRS